MLRLGCCKCFQHKHLVFSPLRSPSQVQRNCMIQWMTSSKHLSTLGCRSSVDLTRMAEISNIFFVTCKEGKPINSYVAPPFLPTAQDTSATAAAKQAWSTSKLARWSEEKLAVDEIAQVHEASSSKNRGRDFTIHMERSGLMLGCNITWITGVPWLTLRFPNYKKRGPKNFTIEIDIGIVQKLFQEHCWALAKHPNVFCIHNGS